MATSSMRAAPFDRAGRRLTLERVPLPQPGPGEVLLRVEAAGICLSDASRSSAACRTTSSMR